MRAPRVRVFFDENVDVGCNWLSALDQPVPFPDKQNGHDADCGQGGASKPENGAKGDWRCVIPEHLRVDRHVEK